MLPHRLLPILFALATVAGAEETTPVSPLDARATELAWQTVNDNVMGGRSAGGFVREDGLLRFAGRTNTNGGGFSSIRAAFEGRLDLSGLEGLTLAVRGDGRTYTLLLRTEATFRGSPIWYRATFATVRDTWIDARVTLGDLVPRWRGRRLDGPPLDLRRVRGLGLMIYDKQDGAFRLDVARVRAYPAARPFDRASLRGRKRPLIVFAPSETDRRLATQRADMEATHADFQDRDMAWIVVLADGTSSIDGMPLRAADAAALRKAYEVPEDAFGLRLVGKDGGVKRATDALVAMSALYAQIDEMPMRRRER